MIVTTIRDYLNKQHRSSQTHLPNIPVPKLPVVPQRESTVRVFVNLVGTKRLTTYMKRIGFQTQPQVALINRKNRHSKNVMSVKISIKTEEDCIERR